MNLPKDFANLTSGLVLGLSTLGLAPHCLAWSSGGMPAEAIVVMFSVWADRCKTDNPLLASDVTEVFQGWRERNRQFVERAEKHPQYEKTRSQLKEAYASETSKPGTEAAFSRVGCRLLIETWRSPAFDLAENWQDSNFGFLSTGKVSPLLLSLTVTTLKEQCTENVPNLRASLEETYKRWRERNASFVASSEADIDWAAMKAAFPRFLWYGNLTQYRTFKSDCPKAFGQFP